MNRAIIIAVFLSTIILEVTSASLLQTCDKLQGVKEGFDNYDLYLVKLKDSSNAEYIINLVDQYQTALDQHASNVHEPSLPMNELMLTESIGLLHGILSQQALFLVCSESTIDSILPDYPRSHIDPPDAAKAKEATLVEHAQPVTIIPPGTPTPSPNETVNTDLCQHIDSQEDNTSTYVYIVKLNEPRSVKDRRKRCLQLIERLNKRISRKFYAIAYPQQSCQNNVNAGGQLIVKLNLKALKYMCAIKGRQISILES